MAIFRSGVAQLSAKTCTYSTRRALQTGLRRLGAEKSDAPVKGIPYNKLTIGVPKESWTNERRVAITPAVVQTLTKKGFAINVEENAGKEASFRNQDYEAAGAKIVPKGITISKCIDHVITKVYFYSDRRIYRRHHPQAPSTVGRRNETLQGGVHVVLLPLPQAES